MPTGMQTGRRTGVSALRTGAKPASGGGGPLKGIMDKWNEMDTTKKTIIMVVAAVLVIGAIALNVTASANKPVPLYATNIDPMDAREIQQRLAQWGITYSVAEGGTNVLVHPKNRHRALLMLADSGLPRRQVKSSIDLMNQKAGMVPDTKEDKLRKNIKYTEGDLTLVIRQINGVSDAFVKIVPKPDNAWGKDETSATASIMLRMSPGAQLSKKQIKGIVNLVTHSVAGLNEKHVKIVDTEGRTLNERLGDSDQVAMEGGSYTTKELAERDAIEKHLQKKVERALGKFVGSSRSDVEISVELDHSQKETTSKTYGGPANVKGYVDTGVTKKEEVYDDGSKGGGGSADGIQELSGTATNGKTKYKTSAVTIRRKVNESVVRKVDTKSKIKRITCGVFIDGIKDPEKLEKIQLVVQNAIGYDATRGDSVAVVDHPIPNNELLTGIQNQQANPIVLPPHTTGADPAKYLPWLAIPMVILLLVVVLFATKQKNVQKEKQRLVLSSGPGSTVSDISDLLADKEGKVTTPPATKVNTTDQLENLAKEKPTKVAELLKSTWLADR